MTEKEKCEAYVRTVLVGNDSDVFSRNDLRQYIAEAWTAGYSEGAYDFGDTISSMRIPLMKPMTRMQAEKLAEQIKQLNEISKAYNGRSALADMIMEDIEKLISQQPHKDLSEMIEVFGDKLKLYRLKSNEQTKDSNDYHDISID